MRTGFTPRRRESSSSSLATFKLFALAATLATFALAAPNTTRKFTFDVEPGKSPTSPRLLVWDKGSLVLRAADGTAFLPNRVYGVHNREDSSWAYVLTTPAGKLPTPLELFVPGSVVVATQLGGPVPTERFQLSPTYRWSKTDKYEMHYFWNPASPRVVKRVRFFTPPALYARTRVK